MKKDFKIIFNTDEKKKQKEVVDFIYDKVLENSTEDLIVNWNNNREIELQNVEIVNGADEATKMMSLICSMEGVAEAIEL